MDNETILGKQSHCVADCAKKKLADDVILSVVFKFLKSKDVYFNTFFNVTQIFLSFFKFMFKGLQ